ncbi:CPBP family intramembrane metalloprotease [Arcobacter sp. HD9-500m-PIT-SAG03]|nr:CPBP family intramembrane metalloprotease [Arcobacter sp. HD9-500m-PIT-SAG03]
MIQSITFQLLTVIAIICLSVLSKYIKDLRIFNKTIHLWFIFLGIAFVYCLYLNYISFVGGLIIVLLFLSASYGNSTRVPYLQLSLGILSGLIFLALSLHMLPGFHNIVLIDKQIIKEFSTPYTLYFNFDKTLAGLIFFFIFIKSTKKILSNNIKLLSLGVMIFTISLIISISLSIGILEPNRNYLFGIQFISIFLIIQIFSTTLAEEVFFRGFIQANLYHIFKENTILYKTVPLIVSSLLFGLVHFSGGIIYAFLAFLAGLGYGLVYQLTGRIEASILGHLSLNIIHLVFFSYPFSSSFIAQ